MSLVLRETLLASKESILNKEHNLWMGYSHGNKWFTLENIRLLIDFGVTYTKKSFLIWIPSRLYSTNFKYIENESRAKSLRLAFELGDKMRKEIENIVAQLPEEQREKVIISSYEESFTLKFFAQREILMKEFSKQLKFYELIIEIANDILEVRGRTISKDRAESIALYTLQELPLFLDGVSKIGEGTIHTVIIYPGLGKLDQLVKSIKEGAEFAVLREQLQITNKTGIADVQQR